MRTSQSFSGDAFAIAPDGKVAIADNFSDTVNVYASVAAAQNLAAPIQSFTETGAQFWGDMTFADNDTLLFTENSLNKVFRGLISSGAVTTLGSVPHAGGVVEHDGVVYAVAANNPGQGAVYTVAGGVATPVLQNVGTGYLSGIAFDATGNLLLTDTNDPSFAGAAGKLLRYNTSLGALPAIDLTTGGGSDAYDVVVDPQGDTFVSTNSTITLIPHGSTTAQQFGSAFVDSSFNSPFISGLEFVGNGFSPSSGNGQLWVNASFTDDGRIFGITPLPEPGACALLVLAGAGLWRRRPCHQRRRPMVVSSLVILAAAVAIEGSPRTARADQFFATQVIAQTVNGTPTGFTNPTLALGAPHGEGLDAGSTDVYSLTNGGSLTLGFDDNNPTSHRYIVDGPGPDFIVSENAFDQNDDPHRSFAELMFVEVSTDGVNFQRFVNYSTTPGPVGPFGVIDPDNVAGFAGVNPVFANGDENSINPFEVGAAGGDVFDLSSLKYTPLVLSGAVDLQHIRYVRLVDVVGDGSASDSFGRPIYDPTGGAINGADVDAVTVINGVHAPEPAGVASLFTAAAVLRRRRFAA